MLLNYYRVLLQDLTSEFICCVTTSMCWWIRVHKGRSHLSSYVFCLCLYFEFNPTPSCRSIPKCNTYTTDPMESTDASKEINSVKWNEDSQTEIKMKGSENHQYRTSLESTEGKKLSRLLCMAVLYVWVSLKSCLGV